MTNPDPSRRRCWGWRRRLDRGGKDRLVLGVAVESVFQCDAEIVEARRLRLIRIARADAVVFGFQRDAESVGQLFLQTEPQAERIALGRVVELWPRDDEFVLRVDVLGHERLDERPLPDYTVRMRFRRCEAAEHGERGQCLLHLPAYPIRYAVASGYSCVDAADCRRIAGP